ncbi:TetR/AcrR family transcriptional regulator [Streptomyces sp. SID1121]|uniref:TetR/AcrR family transcriptional regulator n=1 Tax=Streptomyces sp. SID1121 TaxID=3425888 RepID=UPI00405722A3
MTESPRRPYDSTRRRAAARHSRGVILDACRELLFRDGYRATTVRAVAERAGVSPETLYKTFGSKAQLMEALWDVTQAGDDEPLTMAERPVLQEVLRARDPYTKLRLYAGFVRGVHERLAPLFTLLTSAGGEVAELLAGTEEERLTGITAFVGHLATVDLLPAGADRAYLVDACWVLTGPDLFQRFTVARGWDAETYETWLADTLSATLLPGDGRA